MLGFTYVHVSVLVFFFCKLNLPQHAAAVFGVPSNEGIIDISEDIGTGFAIDASGFSYGAVPIKISTLTYSEYAARGFNLEDDFSPSVIPANAADGELLGDC